MNDWNKNGKYDMADSYMDYHLASSGTTSGSSSDWWIRAKNNLISRNQSCKCLGCT